MIIIPSVAIWVGFLIDDWWDRKDQNERIKQGIYDDEDGDDEW